MSVTHDCPGKGEGLMRCCGKTPFEVPATDRMTEFPSLVTCNKSLDDLLAPTPCPCTASGRHCYEHTRANYGWRRAVLSILRRMEGWCR